MARGRRRHGEQYWANIGLAGLALAVCGLVVFAMVNVGGASTAAEGRALPSSAVPAPTPSTSEQPQPPEVPVLLEQNFADSPDGPPEEAATGQPFRIHDTGLNTSGLEVADGQLRHGDPTAKNAAGYLEAELPHAVQRIGGEAVFSADSGSIALVIWETSIAEARNKPSPDPVPRAGVHFVADPVGWHLGVFTGSGEDILKSVKYASPLAADGETAYAFDVVRQGDQAWITDPTGTVTGPISDPRIADWEGPWACWELYEFSPDRTPARFTRVWAG